MTTFPSLSIFYFVIDTRENKLLQWYGEKVNDKWVPKKEYQTYIRFEQLPCGDVCFYSAIDSVADSAADGVDANKYVPVVLIERKEVKDLSGCIYNKSYTEQKMRMLKYQSENPTVQLIYLVENFTIATKNDLKRVVNPGAPPNQQKNMQVLLSAIVSTMLRDNFFTMTTQGFEGTVAVIERIYQKWPDYKADLLAKSGGTDVVNTDVSNGASSGTSSGTSSSNTEYLKNVKVQKKLNLGPQQWFVTSLSQIQGVSVDKATEVAKAYPTFKSLIDAYESLKTSKEKEQLLKDVVCGTRKLGPVCSKRIYEYVCQILE